MYRTVTIGKTTWLAQNLNFKTNDSWCYNNDEANCAKYGRLYSWDAAMRACPSGWSLPNNNHWSALVSTIGGDADKLKSRPPAWDGTDEFGFSAMPAGGRLSNGKFVMIGAISGWWDATEDRSDTDNATFRTMMGGLDEVGEVWNPKSSVGSVRCVKD